MKSAILTCLAMAITALFTSGSIFLVAGYDPSYRHTTTAEPHISTVIQISPDGSGGWIAEYSSEQIIRWKPKQETFTIAHMMEINGFLTANEISFVKISHHPGSGGEWSSVIINNPAQIQAAWDILLHLELTAHGASQIPMSYEQVTVDFNFRDPYTYWNTQVSIEMFGQVFVYGLGPFIFTDASSPQAFVDLMF